MEDSEIYELFGPIYSELLDADDFSVKRPLLAHYTSIETLEKILKSDEIWFSNPLFMNDLDEIRFGMMRGIPLVSGHSELAVACGSGDRLKQFIDSFTQLHNEFYFKQLFDTYVFCLSEIDREDHPDGSLAMWRGYGANGNGAAIVFDTNKLNPIHGSPLILAKVYYGSTADRERELSAIVSKFSSLLAKSILSDDQMRIAAFLLFDRIKLFSLFTKHHGFSEEREWRVVYMPSRDPNNKLANMFGYRISDNGVEPCLHFKVAPIEGITMPDLTLCKIIDRVLLGPSIASSFSHAAVARMASRCGKDELAMKITPSSIPFRQVKR